MFNSISIFFYFLSIIIWGVTNATACTWRSEDNSMVSFSPAAFAWILEREFVSPHLHKYPLCVSPAHCHDDDELVRGPELD